MRELQQAEINNISGGSAALDFLMFSGIGTMLIGQQVLNLPGWSAGVMVGTVFGYAYGRFVGELEYTMGAGCHY